MTRAEIPGLDAAVAAIRSAGRITVACHVNPDGDALGSLFGATLGLRKMGKEAAPTWAATPPEVPPGYTFLPGANLLVHPDELPQSDLFLALDCGAANRLGDLEDAAKAAGVSVNIDHHPGNDGFATHNVVVTTASSTAELVAYLLADLGIEMDHDIATCLYTGIVTDTGNFQYTNARPATLRLAADLLEYDVDKEHIAQQVYQTAPFGLLALMGRVLGRAKLFETERFVYSIVTHDDLRATGVVMEETDKLIDVLRSTRDADVVAIFKEQGDGGYRVSMRSKAPISVGAIARERGGGGHDLAAGFETTDIDATVAGIVDELGQG
jgi:phosphoesterase RecJ-like protein